MNTQKYLEVQASVQQWIDDFMINYGVSAAEMSAALTSVLNNLKDKMVVDYLVEISQQQQPQPTPQEEEEVNDR